MGYEQMIDAFILINHINHVDMFLRQNSVTIFPQFVYLHGTVGW